MRLPRRRGNALIVALMLGTLLGFSALSVDLGLVRVAQTQLQATIDSAAISGASELDGTTNGISRARSTAITVGGLNPVLGVSQSVPTSAIQIGTWDADASTFTLWDGVSDAQLVNAVIVDYTPAQVASVLGGVAFGTVGYTIHARSTATRPTGHAAAQSTKCFLPIAVPDCWLSGLPAGTNPPPFKFTFSPSPSDKISWGDPDGNPSSSGVRDQLMGQCDHDEIAVGDPIFVNEGNHTSALQTIRDILNDMTPVEPGSWDSTMYGAIPARDGTHANSFPGASVVAAPNWTNTLEGPVALVNAGGSCASVSFTGSLPMTGVAWAVIYDVADTGSDKNIWVQLDVVNEHDIYGTFDESKSGNVLAPGDPTLVNF